MNYQGLSKEFFLRLIKVLKPLFVAVIIVVVLEATSLMSSVSDLGHRAILASGLKDGSATKGSSINEDLDYQFTIKDLEDKKYSFDQFKGKVIFLNLWATWCGPCRAEMADIQKLYSKISSERIVFVMLSIDKDLDKGKVVNYLKSRKFTFPAYMPSGFLPSQLRVPAIPTTFIISKEGKIVRKEVGAMNYDTPKFKKFLEELSR